MAVGQAPLRPHSAAPRSGSRCGRLGALLAAASAAATAAPVVLLPPLLPRALHPQRGTRTSTLHGSWRCKDGGSACAGRGQGGLTRGLVPRRAAAIEVDAEYPGTAVQRLESVHQRVQSLSPEELSVEWEEVRRKLLWAGGLRDLRDVPPGRGYTGHAFNDDNHCDLTTMLGSVANNENEGEIQGIAVGNLLGPGIEVASLPELGPGGSWSTCTNGCHMEPPQDVAHVQFRSRVAFKLVWCPPGYESFVLVDDGGAYLNHGNPKGALPPQPYRAANYKLTRGSKYARAAESFARLH